MTQRLSTGVRGGVLALSLALVGGAAVPAGATAARCARSVPVEVETLRLSFVRDPRAHRGGEQVALRIRVTRGVDPGSPASPVTERLPIAFAMVTGRLTSSQRTLDEASQETDREGWITLLFNLPPTAKPGAADIDATVRYTTVATPECGDPVLVETGQGAAKGVTTVRR